MNIKASVVLLLILTPVVLMSHISWSQEENGLLFNVDGRDVDFVGIVKDTWRTTTKRCDAVTELESADRRFKIIQTLVQTYSPPDSTQIRDIHIWTSGSWAIAEVEFERLLPAVDTIKNIDTHAAIVDNAIWSGITKPWKSGPFIRAYLQKNATDTPENLLNCFELRTGSFN